MRRLLPLLALLLPLAACDPAPSKSDGVAVTATDTTCEVATTTFAPGNVKFYVTNKGSKVTEVYVYAAGSRIVAEVENIGPGTSRDLSADLAPGTYEIACKPGQTGDGIRKTITVTGTVNSSASPTPTALAQKVVVAVSAADLRISGNITPPVGSSVEFELNNTASVKRELEIIDPNGKEVAAIAADPNGSAETTIRLTLPGKWTLKIEDTDLVQTLTVA